MAAFFGPNPGVAVFNPDQASQTKQPFWDPGGFKWAPSATQGQVYDPSWVAPMQFWSQWDTASIVSMDGTFQVPGLVTVTCRRAHRHQVKGTAGADGGEVTALGFELAEVDMTCQMWAPPQFQQWEQLVAAIQSQLKFTLTGPAIPTDNANDRKKGAFDVRHPGLAALGISSLFFLAFTVPRRTSTPQMYEATFKWQEFSPIKQVAAPVTLKGARGGLSVKQQAFPVGNGSKPQSPSQSGAGGPT